jgi:superfamily II DNA or RNA helicase
MSRVLSYRGYNVDKDAMNAELIEKIKNQLTVVPNIPDDYAQVKPEPFKLYQESSSKLYMPKYYGIKKFGVPDVNKLYDGHDIDVKFTGELRSYQVEAAQKFMEAANDPKRMGGIVNVYCGWGKCLGINTPVLMFDGTVKMVQDIVVGDIIMGDDSTPRNVLSICRGREPLYKIHQDNGDNYVVNQSHILSLKNIDTEVNYDISVTDFLKLCKEDSNSSARLMGYKVPVRFTTKDIGIDPYILGKWLCKSSTDILVKLDDEQSRRILPHYKCNSPDVQLNILAGVIDECGVYVNDFYAVVFGETIPEQELKKDVVYIARSVGFIVQEIGMCTIHIIGNRLIDIPVRVPWKKANSPNPQNQELWLMCKMMTTSVRIEAVGEGNYYGFEIDGNRRFVLGDFTVTHNTTLAIHVMCALAKKTLIVCHKDFLLQQWKERIEQFTTSARIGLVKAKVVDVEDKDIVLASLQSLSMKDYDETVFKTFGLFIADEAHHFPAEVFSKALKKVNFKYALGLSATLTRKDGLTKVLKWYIGDVVYKAEKRQDELSVEFLEYYDPNPTYSLEVKGYNNKLNVSRMINNVCDYRPRGDFIVNRLVEVLKREPERKVIILSDRRNHLDMLQKMITNAGYESAFYVGGMKQDELKQSEEKQVILATYHIAAEGFDCPGLDTLILASPKSDVIQCVGRIQRTPQHMRKHVPLVLDIVDNFSLFARQGKKRCAYYESCKYDVKGNELFKSQSQVKIELNGACFIDD